MDPHELRSVELFNSLTDGDRRSLARWTDLLDLPAGKTLMEEGQIAHEFLVIVSGSAHVTRAGTHVRTLGPGDFVGEIALLADDRRRTATVVTTSEVRAVVMTGAQFRALMGDVPAVAAQVQNAVQARLSADLELDG